MHGDDVQEALYQNCEILITPGSGVQALGRGQYGHIVNKILIKNKF